MSFLKLNGRNRNRMLASAAVVAMIASGAVGAMSHVRVFAGERIRCRRCGFAVAGPSLLRRGRRARQAGGCFGQSQDRERFDPVRRAFRPDGQSAAAGARVLQAFRRSERRVAEQPGTAACHRPGVRLLHFRRRLYRHQQPRRGERQVRHRHHGQTARPWTPK